MHPVLWTRSGPQSSLCPGLDPALKEAAMAAVASQGCHCCMPCTTMAAPTLSPVQSKVGSSSWGGTAVAVAPGKPAGGQ